MSGRRPARELLLAGLKRLEYRGYDSAGISVIAEDRIEAVRAVGNLDALQDKMARLGESQRRGSGPAVAVATPAPAIGIGHTRWATHGRVSEDNAHPHFDSGDRVHVVVNGIVENYMALKQRLRDAGSVFTSETDAEVIAHLIAGHYADDLADAVRAAYLELEGHFAFVAMCLDEPRGACRSAQGVPADRRARRRRAVHRLGGARVPRADARGAVHRERRHRRAHARGRDDHEPAGDGCSAGADGRLGRGDG